jgi:Ca-activated chloride channel family protein
MKKTVALFGLAASLLVGAVAIDLWSRTRSAQTDAPPPPPPPPPPVAEEGDGSGAIKIGDVVELDGALSNDLVRSGVPNELFLRMNLQAKDVASGERSPMAMAVVIDRSGSMQGEKIEKVREAAKELVRRLSDKDRITIVSYATDVTVDLPLVAVGKVPRARIERTIDAIADGGGTNLSGGLEAGVAELANSPAEGFVSRLVLLSDGNANQGITEPAEIAELAKKSRGRGVTISTLGVGVDFNEDLMTMVAEAAGGAYYYARDAASTAKALASEFKALSRIAARQVEVSLQLGPEVTVKDVYGYRTEMQRGALVIPVGDMTSAEKRRIVVHLRVERAGSTKLSVAKVGLSYATTNDRDRRDAYQGALAVSGTSDEGALKRAERREVIESAESVLAAAERKEAVDEFQNGNKADALRRLGSQLERTRTRANVLGSAELSGQAAEIETAIKNLVNYSSDSDEGKDLVKREKHRAREIFAY